MKTVVLNGLSEKDNGYENISQRFINAFDNNTELEIINLREKSIAFCRGCFGCWINSPGNCVIYDDGREIAKKVINSDKVIFLTPVTFGGFSSLLKKAVDRLIPNILPHFKKVNGEIHHKKRYEKYPEIAAVGLMDKEDKKAENIFSQLLSRLAINLYSPVYRSFFLHKTDSEEKLGQQIKNICMEVE